MFESRWRFRPTAWALRDGRARHEVPCTAGPAWPTVSRDDHHARCHARRPGCAAGSNRPMPPTATSRSRTCPSAASAAAERALAHRRGHRRPGAGPEARRAAPGAPDGPTAGAAGRGDLNAFMAWAGRPGRCAPRCRTALAEGSAPGRPSWSSAWCRRRRPRWPALRHRRLHRLLHRHPPRHRGGQAVPARQPAAAQLQVGAHRLPRPRLVHRRQRPAGAPARCGQTWGRARPVPSFGPTPAPGLRAGAGHLIGRQRAGRARAHGRRPKTSCSAWCCSTTGRRATSRPGNTSRSGPSWRRTSPARSRPGW
jgi:hypothetical protein